MDRGRAPNGIGHLMILHFFHWLFSYDLCKILTVSCQTKEYIVLTKFGKVWDRAVTSNRVIGLG